MARKARSEILYDGSFGHIFSRSIEGRRIFKDDNDFRCFKDVLIQQKTEKRFKVYHYCLMQTHFHLAVGMGLLEDFSKGLQQLKWRYTRYFNTKYKRQGPLWRERFGSMLIENEGYLCACGKYIEQNPVKAGIVDRVEEWPYSSARYYCLGEKDELLDENIHKEVPDDVSVDNEDEFERGWWIGSGGFKYKKMKGIG